MWVKDQLLKKRSKPLVTVAGFVFVALIGLFDYLSGVDINLAIFYLPAVYLVAWSAGRWQGIVIAVAVAFTGFLSEVADLTHFSHGWIPYVNLASWAIAFAAIAVVVAAMRDLADTLELRVQQRTAQLESEMNERKAAESAVRETEKKILEISDREQARIGQDLHDGLCQLLVSAAFTCNGIQQQLSAASRPEAGRAEELGEMLDSAITDARQLARGLYPVKLETDGLTSALEELAASIRRRFPIECVLDCPHPVLVRDNAIATHLYRIAQEAVNNAVKHSGGDRVVIQVCRASKKLELSVTDNGRGIDLSLEKKGMGLNIMDYRTRRLGGTLKLSSPGERGTTVLCSVPLAATKLSKLA
jgi:signal transduction histidine kinase